MFSKCFHYLRPLVATAIYFLFRLLSSSFVFIFCQYFILIRIVRSLYLIVVIHVYCLHHLVHVFGYFNINVKSIFIDYIFMVCHSWLVFQMNLRFECSARPISSWIDFLTTTFFYLKPAFTSFLLFLSIILSFFLSFLTSSQIVWSVFRLRVRRYLFHRSIHPS